MGVERFETQDQLDGIKEKLPLNPVKTFNTKNDQIIRIFLNIIKL